MIRIVTISLLVLIASCSRTIERVPEPNGLIPKDKMVTVVKDMMILESHIQANYGQVGMYYKVMQRSGDSLLATFNLDRKTYEASIDYYGSRQDEMQEIYTESLEKMNEELGKLESE
ncbi:MAG: DUF4296 domain-containing protein [Crocinitomicaceae bacterium]|nr:DUF4296 domain-containing protein [Crocinitomicaceae bacterium]